ncbi:hypothetical protein Scep_005012 [Stephania cephalantha]|uniref:Uncharacterized protein n=1 Tax=Stephania cephalantha TaxID=152367 RepID=A0AAP0PVY3_9MAGN
MPQPAAVAFFPPARRRRSLLRRSGLVRLHANSSTYHRSSSPERRRSLLRCPLQSSSTSSPPRVTLADFDKLAGRPSFFLPPLSLSTDRSPPPSLSSRPTPLATVVPVTYHPYPLPLQSHCKAETNAENIFSASVSGR